jgi:hypothetical protein
MFVCFDSSAAASKPRSSKDQQYQSMLACMDRFIIGTYKSALCIDAWYFKTKIKRTEITMF